MRRHVGRLAVRPEHFLAGVVVAQAHEIVVRAECGDEAYRSMVGLLGRSHQRQPAREADAEHSGGLACSRTRMEGRELSDLVDRRGVDAITEQLGQLGREHVHAARRERVREAAQTRLVDAARMHPVQQHDAGRIFHADRDVATHAHAAAADRGRELYLAHLVEERRRERSERGSLRQVREQHQRACRTHAGADRQQRQSCYATPHAAQRDCTGFRNASARVHRGAERTAPLA
jgi:hypothetical protein